MRPKRIIPCLDVNKGRVVKGTKFVELRDAGDPVENAIAYNEQGADELVFLDITASTEDRDTIVDVVARTAKHSKIPLTVGGGIRTVKDVEKILQAGASKVGINTAAVKTPELITEISKEFGSQCAIAAIDAKQIGDNRWEVYTLGGGNPTGLDVIEWAKKVEDLGAGEILLTSIDLDGMKTGYDIPLNAAVSDAVNIPVIASGGAGTLEHMVEVLTAGKADAVLAASIFHFREVTVRQIKEYLKQHNIPVYLEDDNA